jgi:hypothetical protein
MIMTSSTGEYLRRRDRISQREAKHKKKFEVKRRKCKVRNQKIIDGNKKEIADTKKGLTYKSGMTGPYSNVICALCGIKGHSRKVSKSCARNKAYTGKFSEWCIEVKPDVKIDEFDPSVSCKNCGRRGHEDSASLRCMDHIVFPRNEEDAWEKAMFCWGEDEEVYRGKTTTCRLFRVLARVRVLLCRLARFSQLCTHMPLLESGIQRSWTLMTMRTSKTTTQLSQLGFHRRMKQRS